MWRRSPAAIALSVIRNNLRPDMMDPVPPEAQDFVELMRTCWHEDPTIRPTFLEIMTRFSSYSDTLRSDTERNSR
jgi:hypothetical protein